MIFPNPIRFAKALWRALRARWGGFDVWTTEEEREDRLFSCDLCPDLEPGTRQCRGCTCFVDVKAGLTMEECPRKFWLPIWRKRGLTRARQTGTR